VDSSGRSRQESKDDSKLKNKATTIRPNPWRKHKKISGRKLQTAIKCKPTIQQLARLSQGQLVKNKLVIVLASYR